MLLYRAQHETSSETKKVKAEFLYGINSVTAALCAGKRNFLRLYKSNNPDGNFFNKIIKKIVAQQRLESIEKLTKERNIKSKPMSKQQLLKMTDGKAHQNIVLKCSKMQIPKIKKYNEFKKMLTKPTGNIFLLLDKINDPHNFGALIRTGFYMGIDGIILSTEGSCPITPVVTKVSSGATELVQIFQVKYISDFIIASKMDNWELITADSSGKNCKFLGQDPLEKKPNVFFSYHF